MFNENNRLTFIRSLNDSVELKVKWGIHPTAIIEDNVILPDKVSIGPMTYICKRTKIGESSIIGSKVFINSSTKIGQNVYIQDGATIGCEGLGFERNEDNEFEKFPQFGFVVIEDDVEIGANSTIVKGTFFDTRIGKGTKIGHLTSIGHNVKVGNHVFIGTKVVICGSTIVGNYSYLAPGCCIRNKLNIGDNAFIGLGAVVIKDIDNNLTVVGNPAKVLR